MEALLFIAWVVGCAYGLESLLAWHPVPPKRMEWALRQAHILQQQEPRVPLQDAVGISAALAWFAGLVTLVLS